ncbi:hypothetical protein M976_00305 [Buttiauxella ferragutiae ATCC 51602]|uniref:YeeW-like domain-containing protein n=1 Tax=Buttiauxella ferragutiae ATCC 51602 TaxID=1354252 RepID=A0ABX2WDA0_9ENTR|nr:hypothetical protein M976_00305 [Buttiauxella ferragutiae ATCC 51602]
MKLSLNVEADSINVLVLNMGRIAVEIDGIELAQLIDVVCDNGYSLRIADEPGKLLVEAPLPANARYHGIQCSAAHITREDNDLLHRLSRQARAVKSRSPVDCHPDAPLSVEHHSLRCLW